MVKNMNNGPFTEEELKEFPQLKKTSIYKMHIVIGNLKRAMATQVLPIVESINKSIADFEVKTNDFDWNKILNRKTKI